MSVFSALRTPVESRCLQSDSICVLDAEPEILTLFTLKLAIMT